MRVRGRAVVPNPAKKRAKARRSSPAHARYTAGRSGTRTKARKLYGAAAAAVEKAKAKRRRSHTGSKRGHRARRSTPMARLKGKGSRKRSEAMKKLWRARKRAGKMGRLGHTRVMRKKRRKGRKSAASHAMVPMRRKKRKSAAPARRKRASAPRRRKRRSAAATTWITRPARRRKRHSTRTRRSARRTRRVAPTHLSLMYGPGGTTVKNPSRRRMRKNPSRGHRRYMRRYRRNPGNMFIDLAKQAIPVLLSVYGTRVIVNKIGPIIPGVSALGSLQAPVLSIGALGLAHFATKKVGALAKHKMGIMLGAAFATLDSIITAFAPASVKQLVAPGMGDYVSMGDYVGVGAVPLDDRMTLSDYVGVGGDGISEELGLEEELGAIEEELGNVRLGGLPGPVGSGLMKPVAMQRYVEPVPARSFTAPIPAATQAYDKAADLYGGIFGGGFGH